MIEVTSGPVGRGAGRHRCPCTFRLIVEPLLWKDLCNIRQVQILNKKVDLSKVTSKCGSKDNIKHKPGELGTAVGGVNSTIFTKACLSLSHNVSLDVGGDHQFTGSM